MNSTERTLHKKKQHTLIYVEVPTNVSAIEFMSSPETPKSQILISPRELHRIFEGLMSENET